MSQDQGERLNRRLMRAVALTLMLVLWSACLMADTEQRSPDLATTENASPSRQDPELKQVDPAGESGPPEEGRRYPVALSGRLPVGVYPVRRQPVPDTDKRAAQRVLRSIDRSIGNIDSSIRDVRYNSGLIRELRRIRK